MSLDEIQSRWCHSSQMMPISRLVCNSVYTWPWVSCSHRVALGLVYVYMEVVMYSISPIMAQKYQLAKCAWDPRRLEKWACDRRGQQFNPPTQQDKSGWGKRRSSPRLPLSVCAKIEWVLNGAMLHITMAKHNLSPVLSLGAEVIKVIGMEV